MQPNDAAHLKSISAYVTFFMVSGGDDLEDDFHVSGDEVEGFNVSESGSAQEEPSNDSRPIPHGPNTKKRKRREKLKANRAKKRKLVQSEDLIETSLADRPPQQLADYLASAQSATFSEAATSIELNDMGIPETSIVDTTGWAGSRTLDDLPAFIMKVLPTLHMRLSQRSKANGAPTLLFIAGAALRVADVTRVLKDKALRADKSGEVAKLFARHFKLSEHVTYLKRTKVVAAVGTPGRVGKLLCETDALSISALSHIILDITFRDTKNRNVLDISETRDEVFRTVLGCPSVLQGIKAGRIQVVLF